MNKTRIIWGLGACVILAFIIGSVMSYTKDNSIKIGAILSLTGNGAAYGQPAKNGIEIALKQINEKGGINGRKVEVVYEDSQFDPKIALSAYQSLKARGVRLFITNGSGVSLAVRKPVVDNHDFQFETAAVTPVFSDHQSNTCRITLTAPVSGNKLGDFIVTDVKAKSVAALTLNDDYGKAMTSAVSDSVSSRGVSVTMTESFDKNATDFRTQIAKLAEAKPDVLLVVPAAGQAPAIFKQLKEFGWKGAVVSDSWTIVNDNLKDLSLVEGNYFVNYDWMGSAQGNESVNTRTFKSEYILQYGNPAPVVAANAYDSLQLMANAISVVGAAGPEKLGTWLSENVKDYSGVTGSITLDQDCEASRAAVIQQVQSGKFVSAH